MREGWKTYSLGEICTIVKGTSPTLKTAPGPYPLIVTAALPSSSIEYQFDGEAVCIPMVSSTGHGHASLKRVHYASGKFAVANIIAAVQAKDPSLVSPKFLGLYLQHFKDELIVTRMRGTANVSLSIAGLATIPVELPPLEEQQRIVDLIDSVDASIEAADFATEATSQAVTDLRAEMLTPRMEWKESPLDELASFDNGYPFKPGELGAEGLPVIRIKQLLDDSVEPDRSEAVVRSSQRIEDGDLIFSWSATIAVRNWNRGPALLNQHLFKVTEKDGVSRGYLRECLESAIPHLHTHGSTMKHVTKKELTAYRVPLPQIDEQEAIAKTLAEASEAALAAADLATSIRASRGELLSVLLSGEHQIPDSYDADAVQPIAA